MTGRVTEYCDGRLNTQGEFIGMIGAHHLQEPPLLQRVGVPACAIDGHGQITWWNAGAEQLFGIPTAQAMGCEWHALVRVSDADGVCGVCQTRTMVAAREPAVATEIRVTARGRSRVLTVVPLPLDDFRPGTLAFLFVDRPPVSSILSSARRARNRSPDAGTPRTSVRSALTRREHQILTCIAEGQDARCIAEHLGISHSTARNYVQRVLTKLGVHTKAEAIRMIYTSDLLFR